MLTVSVATEAVGLQDLCENAPDAQLAAHTAAAGLASCKRLAASAEAKQDLEMQEARRRGCRRVLQALCELEVGLAAPVPYPHPMRLLG